MYLTINAMRQMKCYKLSMYKYIILAFRLKCVCADKICFPGISDWKCEECNKLFPSKGALHRHNNIHTGKPNYQVV